MRLKLSTLNAPISTDETNSTDGTDTGASNNPTLAAPCVDLGLIDVLGPKRPLKVAKVLHVIIPKAAARRNVTPFNFAATLPSRSNGPLGLIGGPSGSRYWVEVEI